jgi:hypothetical protein
MAFIWQIGLYGKKYGKIQKIWHLPYLQGSAAALMPSVPTSRLCICICTSKKMAQGQFIKWTTHQPPYFLIFSKICM